MRSTRIALAAALLAGAGALAVTAAGTASADDVPAVEAGAVAEPSASTEASTAAPTFTMTAVPSEDGGRWPVISGAVTGAPDSVWVDFVRTDAESPTGVAMPPLETRPDGTFDMTDGSTFVGGVATYTGTTRATPRYPSVSAQVSIVLPFASTTLSVRPSGVIYTAGDQVGFSGALGKTFSNRRVEIWTDPVGADQPARLAAAGTVNEYGIFGTNVKLSRNTTVTVKFAGDTRYAPRTASTAIRVKVLASTAITKSYKTAKIGSTPYQYVRKSVHPVFTTSMTWNAGRKQKLTFEYYSGGKWKSWRSGLFPLSKAGKSIYTLTGTNKTGVRYRVRTAYLPGTSGDSLNYTTYGAWKYFTFTS
ncbi:hypothetical protein [Actinoplanes sp. NPDC020271]|uniref:hypothetical protein n=1 Tax=Actinoplanes sp. NPDC020271 TaxID=3363896 RepID=UPI0037A816C9